MRRLQAIIIAALVATASSTTTEHWVYASSPTATATNADDQAATWPALCNEGRLQSPIDIDSSDAAESHALAEGSLQPTFSAATLTLKTTGHNLQAVPPTSANMKTNIRGDDYNLAQVHWHAPSENTVDGQYFAMEAHFVHTLVADSSKLAVVGVMFSEGDECNPTLDALPWSKFGTDGIGEVASNGPVDLTPLLSEDTMLSGGYYHWTGSLTTPPCTEGVDWNLLKVTQTACKAQVDRLKAALTSTQQGIPFNNRAIQPLNQRVVTQSPSGGQSLFFVPNFEGAELGWLIFVAVIGCCGWCVAFRLWCSLLEAGMNRGMRRNRSKLPTEVQMDITGAKNEARASRRTPGDVI